MLDAIGGVVCLREAALLRRGHLKVVVIPIFSVDKEKGVLEAFVHRGSITDFSERSISAVNNDVTVPIRLGSITGDNNCKFIGRWKVPPTSIAVLVCCELNGNIFTAGFIKHFHCMLEDTSPTVVCEDEIL